MNLSAAMSEDHSLNLCDICCQNDLKKAKGDRVLVKETNLNNKLNIKIETDEKENTLIKLELMQDELENEDQTTVGEIMEEKTNDSFEIKILEGKYLGQQYSLSSEGFIKLASVIMPSEKICGLCCYFYFNEKGCMRYGCQQPICGQCYQKYPHCPFCKLLRKENTVKVKHAKLTPENEAALKSTFGEEDEFSELYGIIQNVKIDDDDLNKMVYEVKLALGYDWETNENGIIYSDAKLHLNEPTHTLILNENQVEIFKPNLNELNPSAMTNEESDVLFETFTRAVERNFNFALIQLNPNEEMDVFVETLTTTAEEAFNSFALIQQAQNPNSPPMTQDRLREMMRDALRYLPPSRVLTTTFVMIRLPSNLQSQNEENETQSQNQSNENVDEDLFDSQLPSLDYSQANTNQQPSQLNLVFDSQQQQQHAESNPQESQINPEESQHPFIGPVQAGNLNNEPELEFHSDDIFWADDD